MKLYQTVFIGLQYIGRCMEVGLCRAMFAAANFFKQE